MRRSNLVGSIIGSSVDAVSLSISLGMALLTITIATMPASGQVFAARPGGRLGERLAERLRPPANEAIAVAGSPFGVGRITVQMPPVAGAPIGGAIIAGALNGGRLNGGAFNGGALNGTAPMGNGSILDEPPLTLTEVNGRVFYPAAVDTPVRAAIRELLARPRPATVYFLFTGEAPLDLTLFGPSGIAQRAQVQHDPQLHQQLLAEWWKQYTAAIRRPNRSDDFPHLVDAYLTSMLANRLSLAPIEWPRGLLAEKLPDLDQTVGLALGTESARLAIERDTMLHTAADTSVPAPLQPLPQPVEIRVPLMPGGGESQIEPLAMHVPEECLYIRFAGFPNYQWFRSTLDDWGGDLRNMVSRRGVDYALNARLERQLSLKENALSQLLGPTVIADMALVGDDPFMREGAAMGMLFQARVNALLANDIRRNRMETLAANPDAVESQFNIAGHDVAFLSTPDNRVRSFYAVDGDFHLVTTSRRMVERFYEAGAGTRPLGNAADFKEARGLRPPHDADAVFAYLSTAFFRHLASPQYQIEMMRRLRSATDIELVDMARLAARGERKPADSIEQLISGGFLPEEFSSAARRPDGSRLILQPNGQVSDSLRGGRGTFLPVPDVDVRAATAAEVSAYEQFARSLAGGGTGPIGPTAVAVQRAALPAPGRQRVTLDVRMLPLENNADKFVRPALGPAGRQRLAPLPGDIVSLEVSTSGGGLLKSLFPFGAGGTPTHLFAGIRNTDTPAAAIQSPAIGGVPLQGILSQMLPGISAIEALRWYVGGWPSPGALEGLGIGGPNVQVDAEGYGFGGGFWQRQIGTPAGPITVASQKRDVVAEVAGSLNMIDAQRPAQIWLHIGDLSGSNVADLANRFGYLRARGISHGNANFLHRLTTQLGVPPDQALEAAQRLLDARLVSPIGGRYELQTRSGEFPTWATTGQVEQSGGGLLPTAPAGFESPPLNWLRGIDLYGGSDAMGLWAHAEIDMQRQATGGAANAGQAAPSSAESVATPRATPPGPAAIQPPPPPAPGPK